MVIKIILVNYKGYIDTIECLESLCKLEYDQVQVFIVDNSPTIESFEMLKAWSDNSYPLTIKTTFPQIIFPLKEEKLDALFIEEDDLKALTEITNKFVFIRANENRGFSAANNLAIKFLNKTNNFNWIWLLNNDTVVPASTLRVFDSYVSSSEFDRTQGIIGNSLYYYEVPTRIQGIGGNYNKMLGYSKHIKYDELHHEDVLEVFRIKVDYIMGASMFVSKEVINNVGLMSEDYFLYFEELDWITRAKGKGFRIGFVPSCGVYHKEGASIGSSDTSVNKSKFADYYGITNKILFTKKFFPYFLPTIYISLFLSIILRLLRKQPDRALMIFRIIFRFSK